MWSALGTRHGLTLSICFRSVIVFSFSCCPKLRIGHPWAIVWGTLISVASMLYHLTPRAKHVVVHLCNDNRKLLANPMCKGFVILSPQADLIPLGNPKQASKSTRTCLSLARSPVTENGSNVTAARITALLGSVDGMTWFVKGKCMGIIWI